MVRFNSYAVRRTGLQPSQTLLQLEDYLLICSPFQISMKRVIVLVVLSAEEASFFQKFRGRLCKLSFTFVKPGSKLSISFFARASLERIEAVKGRPNICMADLAMKMCPNDLSMILGEYMMAYAGLKAKFAELAGQIVEVTEKSLPLLYMDPEIDTQIGRLRVKARVLSVAVNRVVLKLSSRVPGLKDGIEFPARFAFGTYKFAATLKVKTIQDDTEQGYKKLACETGFVPELVEAMDGYFRRRRV